jgi:hypothetical protein
VSISQKTVENVFKCISFGQSGNLSSKVGGISASIVFPVDKNSRKKK